jgi:transcriptional regulator with XRE-family HTH domain
MDIRTRIDALLTEKGWGRKTLSRHMGVSPDFIRMFLDKKTQQMGHENLVKAAEALGVTAEYLLNGDPVENDPEIEFMTRLLRKIDKSDRQTAIEVLKRFEKPASSG